MVEKWRKEPWAEVVPDDSVRLLVGVPHQASRTASRQCHVQHRMSHKETDTNTNPLILMVNMTQLNIKDLQHPQENVAVDGDKGVLSWLARSVEQVLEDEEQATIRPNVLS